MIIDLNQKDASLLFYIRALRRVSIVQVKRVCVYIYKANREFPEEQSTTVLCVLGEHRLPLHNDSDQMVIFVVYSNVFIRFQSSLQSALTRHPRSSVRVLFYNKW